MVKRHSQFPLLIISGGQTGADRAALDAAISLDFPYDG
jgi:Circularly permutated YpsA SLOG family